jgi:hypothetical protein
VVNRVVHAADGGSGRAEAIALVLLAVRGQEDDADLLFLEGIATD